MEVLSQDEIDQLLTAINTDPSGGFDNIEAFEKHLTDHQLRNDTRFFVIIAIHIFCLLWLSRTALP